MKENCDCGCNDPVATNSKDMLVFLAQRFDYGAVGDGPAAYYSRDIKKILLSEYGIDMSTKTNKFSNTFSISE